MAVTFTQLRLGASSFLSYFRSERVYRAEDLLSVQQVPDVLREPYIFTGYRRLGQPWKYYLHSILFLHNESINVWTHVGGFFLVLLSLLDYFKDKDVLEDKNTWPVLGFGLCCLFNLVLSSAAHLLHSRSRWHHFLFFLMDYMGVTFYTFGTGISCMYTLSPKWYHDAIHDWFLPLNVLFSWFAFFACCVAKTTLSHDNTKRKALMVAGVSLQGLFLAIPCLTRYAECLATPSCSLSSLNHMAVVFVLIVFCAITFACHCPESLMPGCFDIVGHGHQIFHVLAVIAMLAEIRAMDIEINVLGSARDLRPNLTHICIALFALFMLETLTLLYYVQFIVFRRLSQEIPRIDVQQSLLSQGEAVGEAHSHCASCQSEKKSS